MSSGPRHRAASQYLLVEAGLGNWSDLLAAVNIARHQAGVGAVSMSWGSVESLSSYL